MQLGSKRLKAPSRLSVYVIKIATEKWAENHRASASKTRTWKKSVLDQEESYVSIVAMLWWNSSSLKKGIENTQHFIKIFFSSVIVICSFLIRFWGYTLFEGVSFQHIALWLRVAFK